MGNRKTLLSREISEYDYLIEMSTKELKKLIQKDCFDGEKRNMDDAIIEMILEIIIKCVGCCMRFVEYCRGDHFIFPEIRY